MINENDILKRILLNMKYDSSMTLSENLLKEDFSTTPPDGQTIPITMNQIMQFQKYIWDVIEKDLPKVTNTCRGVDKKTDCARNSVLCPKTKNPCWRSDCIDGLWGGNTIKVWNQYGNKYKKYNPKWWVDDVKTRSELIGQEIPTTIHQTKNFQKWYLEQVEKAKPNNVGLYTTKLCNSPCKYNQAVDGIFGVKGSNTKNLWEKYKTSYVKSNPNWYRNIDFDQNVVRSQERIEKIAKTFIFTTENPSGWNQTSPIPDIPKWIATNKERLFKTNETSATKIANNYGWDVNTKLFPTPKLYTESDFALFMPEGGKEELNKINSEKQEWYGYLEKNKSDYLGSGGAFERQTSVMTGIPTRGEAYESDWAERSKKARGPQFLAGEEWNQNLNAVMRVINEKCKRPLMVLGIGDDKKNAVYISYSDICYYAGGLWVWNVGEGPNTYCGCRVMSMENGLIGEQIFSVKGRDGKDMSVWIDFKSAMAYQTPGGQKDNEKYEMIHDVLTVVELGLLAVSFVSGPFAPLFIGASALAGVIDAGVYYQQGDKYMGTMMLALSLIGFDDFVTLVKWVSPTVKGLGKEGLTLLAKKKLGKEVLNETEKIAIKELETAIYKSQKQLSSTLKIKMGTEFVTTGLYATAIKNKWSWQKFFDIFYKINKKLKGLPGLTLKLGGVSYTVDQVYLALYGNDEDRKYSTFGQLFDYFKNTSESEKLIDAQDAFESLQKTLSENPEEILSGDVIGELFKIDPNAITPKDELEAFYSAKNKDLINRNSITQEKEQEKHKFIQAPTLNSVESGESTIGWGVSGDSVTEIQKLLNEKGYDTNVNGVFDNMTEFAVFSFQNKNKLNNNGIVDNQTLLKLKTNDSPIDCNEKINSMKSSGWSEINKFDYLKKLEDKNNVNFISRVECGGKINYLYNPNQ